jgi:hypothetical protein
MHAGSVSEVDACNAVVRRALRMRLPWRLQANPYTVANQTHTGSSALAFFVSSDRGWAPS